MTVPFSLSSAKVKFTEEKYPVSKAEGGLKALVCLSSNMKANNLKVKIVPAAESKQEGTLYKYNQEYIKSVKSIREHVRNYM